MKVFVTTGTTYPYKKLIQTALSPQVLEHFESLGYTDIVIQFGNGGQDVYEQGLENARKYPKLTVTGFTLSDEIHMYIKQSDLIISHGGTGSILDALRASKRLIAVINQDLMDNHQAEIADQFSSRGYLLVSEPDPGSLVAALQKSKTFDFTPMPPPDTWKLASIIDEEVGLV